MVLLRGFVALLVFVLGVSFGLWLAPTCPEPRNLLNELKTVDINDPNEGSVSEGSLDDIIAVPDPERVLTPPSEAQKACHKNAMVFPGTVEQGRIRPVWKPQGCRLLSMEEMNVKRCFSTKKQIWLGDSLTRDIARKIARFGLGMTRDMHFFTRADKGPELADTEEKGQVYSHVFPVGTAGEFSFYWSAAAVYDGSLNYTITQNTIKSADFVLVGSGMWDMGVAFTPPDKYFDTMKQRLANIKKIMKHGAVLVVNPIHWLNIHRCPEWKQCRTCNDADKAMVYREALSLAAACAGASVLITAPITRVSAMYTTDGAHYDKSVSLMQADVYLNAVCGEMAFDEPTTCNPEEAKARWRTIPAANIGCKGPHGDPFAKRRKSTE
eukprot:TRINITY_DN8314_c0_g1_i1.p1 TRINITY_DN8314_c0_g1~~TRINITY_DN8314_c0_g1_i1.p1  ORF type:complete len:381 (+),score=89.54 TRINITY_DN8314_c0_g1_i1:136-1278(+)